MRIEIKRLRHFYLLCSPVNVPQSVGTFPWLMLNVSVLHLVLWLPSFPLALSVAPFVNRRFVADTVSVDGPLMAKVLKSKRI